MSSRNSSVLATVIVVAIIGSLLLAVTPSFSQLATQPSEVWVNAAWASNGSGDIVDAEGHVFGQNAFATINEGIAGVQTGGIVYVAAGTYAENVQISKSLTLLGPMAGISGNDASRGTGEAVISPATGEGITITCSGVTVDGFDVRSATNAVEAEGSTSINNVAVKNNRLTANTGVYMMDVTGVTVTDNFVAPGTVTGVQLNGCDYATVTGNYIEAASNGIYYEGTYGTLNDNEIHGSSWAMGIYNEGDFATINGNHLYDVNTGISSEGYSVSIKDNVVDCSEYLYSASQGIYSTGDNAVISGNQLLYDSSYRANYGIYADNSNALQITGNTIRNATNSIDVEGEYQYMSLHDITIDNNRIYNNGANYGIYVYVCDDVSVSGNVLQATNGGSFSSEGIYVDTCNGVTVNDNVIGNASDGIYFYGCCNQGYASSIRGNEITNTVTNGGYGIYLEYTGGDITVADNTIASYEDTYWSWGIYSSEGLAGGMISGNNLINTSNGIYLYGCCGQGYKASITGNQISNDAGSDGGYGIEVYDANGVIVSDNVIDSLSGYWDEGIYVYESSGMEVTYNTIRNVSDNGIELGGCCDAGYGSVIQGNVISNDGIYGDYGLYFYDTGGDITIADNVITCTNDVYWDYGLYSSEGLSNAMIKNNTFVNSYYYGIYYEGCCGGGYLGNIIDNKILNYGEFDADYGIYVDEADGVTISGNVIDSENGTWEEGIELYYASGAQVKDNIITNATYYGVYAYGCCNGGYGNTILGNTIANNVPEYEAEYGIYLDYLGDNVTVADNVIDTVIGSTWDYGIYVDEGMSGSAIRNNTIVNVDDTGIYFYGCCGSGYMTDFTGNKILNYGEFDAYYGMYLYEADGARVIGNVIDSENGMWDDGIYLDYSSGLSIEENAVSNATDGIYINSCCSSGSDSLIQGNTITNGIEGYTADAGVYLYFTGSNVSVLDNAIVGNNGYWYYGVYMDDTFTGSAVDNNTITNAMYGVYYENSGDRAYDSSISGNIINITDESVDAYDAIYFQGGNAITIADNRIDNAVSLWYNGVYLEDSSACTVEGNDIKNATYGVYVCDSDSASTPTGYGTVVKDNNISLDIGSMLKATSNYAPPSAIFIGTGNGCSVTGNYISGSDEFLLWIFGIYMTGYSGTIADNSIQGTMDAIAYDGFNQFGSTSISSVDDVMGVLSSSPAASVAAASAGSDFCDVTGNVINATGAEYPNEGIVYTGCTGTVSGNTIRGGNYTVYGIAAQCDNLSVTNNLVTGMTMNGFYEGIAPMDMGEIGGAIVIIPDNFGTIKGSASLSGNQLMNNRVQFIFVDGMVYTLDGAPVEMDTASLENVLDNNVLDRAAYIVDADGNLVMEPFNMGPACFVWGNATVANTYVAEGQELIVHEYTQTYTYNLVPGWNLISVPLDVSSNSVTEFFPADVMSKVWDVWGWNDATQTWTYYSPDPNTPYTGFEPITTMDTGKAYWVNMDSSAMFTIEGTVPAEAPNAPFPLVSNWNFVGLTGLTPSTPDVMYPTAWDVWGWNAEAQHWTYYSSDLNTPYKGYEPITAIQPGHGQWVNM